MSDKLKRGLAISALAFAHLFATFFFNLSAYAEAIATFHGQSKQSEFSVSVVTFLLAAFEFPLVYLVKLIPYQPELPSSSLVAFAYLLSYFANSILWGAIIYGACNFVTRRRALRRS